jgi:biopolymer transport protein ExbD
MVILMVLIAFMVVTPPFHNFSQPDLFRSRHMRPMLDSLKENALVVGIQRDGAVYLATSKVSTPEELAVSLRARLSEGAEHRVYMKVDSRARYGTVKQILDAVSAAGINQISFLTD